MLNPHWKHWACGAGFAFFGIATLGGTGDLAIADEPARAVQYRPPLQPPEGAPGPELRRVPDPYPPGPFAQPMPPPALRQRPPSVRDYSFIYIDIPEPRRIQVHDILTVIVDEKSEVTEDSRYTRQKNGILKAELKEFVRIDNDFNLANAAPTSPKIDTNLQGTLNSRGQLQSREGIKYRIAATVVDVLPNGTVILEARKSIRTNRDVWEYSLTGRIRTEDILANNTVLSENIADLDIVKRERGRIRDSTRRGFILMLYDFFSPI